MKFKLLTILAALFITQGSLGQVPAGAPPAEVKVEQKNVPEYLQNISTTIKSETEESKSQGSGVIFTRKDVKGDSVSFILTAAHVLENLRQERQVLTLDGQKKTIVEFASPVIMKHIIENGRVIGKTEIEATVIKWSSPEFGQDLSLLKLRKKNFTTDTAVFITEEIVPVGTELYHLGSRLGEFGAGQLTSGLLSSIGKVLGRDQVFDVGTIQALPGSSGGGVFIKQNGFYCAMVQQKATAGETFIFIKPARIMKEWAKEQKVEWFYNSTIPLPSDEEFKKIPIEDNKG